MLDLLGGWWGAFRMTIIASAVIACVLLVRDYSSRGEQIVALTKANKQFAHQVSVLKANTELLRKSVDVVDGRLVTMFKDLEESCTLLDIVKKDQSPDADKAVANPVGTLLERLGGETRR